MKIINYEYSSTNFSVNFENKINLLVDNSGTGKTFLLNMLKFYCDEGGISCAHVDYLHQDVILDNKDILLFDRADLYLTSEMFNKISSLDATSIISIKSTVDLNLVGDIGFYRVLYYNKSIVTRRWG